MWEGIVTAVHADQFSVLLYQTGKRIEFGEIPFRAIRPEQVELVEAGAVFTWSSDTKSFTFLPDGKLTEDEFEKRLEEAISSPAAAV